MSTLPGKPATATAIAVKPSAINLMAARMNVEPTKLFDTLKATVFKNCTNEELLALVVVANEYGLSPFLKEIFAFPAKGGGIVPIISVDGWGKMLIRQPDFDGIEFEFADDDKGEVYSCTCTIYVKNRSHPVKITEYLHECKRNTEPWNNMPRRMLRNRTLCQASRVAFGFSSQLHEDEAFEISATVVPMPSEPLKKIAVAAEAGQPPSDDKTPQEYLESIVVSGGFTFADLQKFGSETGTIPDPTSFGSFADLPSDVCKRLRRAQDGLLKGLGKIKESK